MVAVRAALAVALRAVAAPAPLVWLTQARQAALAALGQAQQLLAPLPRVHTSLAHFRLVAVAVAVDTGQEVGALLALRVARLVLRRATAQTLQITSAAVVEALTGPP
jgi:hypothetical protein